MNNYLDPFCAAVLFLYLVKYEKKRLFGQEQLHATELVTITVFLIVIFETVFPLLSNRFTADILDGIIVGAGTCWFEIFQRLEKKQIVKETAKRGENQPS